VDSGCTLGLSTYHAHELCVTEHALNVMGLTSNAAAIVKSRHHLKPCLPAGGGMALQPALPLLSPPLPCFHPVPESQPVLPCLLRRLLQRGALAEAHALARRHESGPHFHRSLEWLLFTALEMESSKPLVGVQ
jgi:hypothetical protein